MIGTMIVVIGALISAIGGIMVLIKAFQQSVLWGIGCFLCGFVSLYFIFTHWSDPQVKKGFLISLGGAVICVLGVIVGIALGGASILNHAK